MKFVLLPVLTAALLNAAAIQPVQTGGLTVHEWGTFTSVAAEDGSSADWNTLGCKDDLPGFVNDFGYRNLKIRLGGTVRMETPVLYFYSSHELNARVKVSFPQGLITEWYPQAENKVFHKDDGLAVQVGGPDSFLRNQSGAIEWTNLKIQPATSPVFARENGISRYYAARETDASPLSVGDQHEKFLFYRGVGQFQVPLSARISANGTVTVNGSGPDAFPTVILFEKRGGRVGYREVHAVHDAVALNSPVLNGSLPELRSNLEHDLVAQGLFPKEAHAMIETWQDTWFEEGSRLIYIMPGKSVDAVLPLQVEPAPLQTNRVFVGRIELITPGTRRVVEAAIAHNDLAAIDQYRRFLKPILERIYPGDKFQQDSVEQKFRSPCK